MQSIHVFFDIENFADFRWKIADSSRTHGMCHVIHVVFGPLKVRYDCPKFHHCRIYMREFMEGEPTIREEPQKILSWLGLILAKISWKKETKLFP